MKKPDENIELKDKPPERPADENYDDHDQQQETSFIHNGEGEDYDDDEDNEQNTVDRLPYDHPLRKTWGNIRKNVKPSAAVEKNEKIAFLRDNLDIKVYRDYYSRLMLENIEIKRNRKGEDYILEYRKHKVFVLRGEQWTETRNPLNKKYLVEFKQLAEEIRKERLASPAGELERLMNLDKTNPEEKEIEWFEQRDVEDVEVENVKSRIRAVLEFMEDEVTKTASTDMLKEIQDLKNDLALMDDNKKPESETGIRLLNEEIASLKRVNRLQEWCRRNLGPLSGIATTLIGAVTLLVFMVKKKFRQARRIAHRLKSHVVESKGHYIRASAGGVVGKISGETGGKKIVHKGTHAAPKSPAKPPVKSPAKSPVKPASKPPAKPPAKPAPKSPASRENIPFYSRWLFDPTLDYIENTLWDFSKNMWIGLAGCAILASYAVFKSEQTM